MKKWIAALSLGATLALAPQAQPRYPVEFPAGASQTVLPGQLQAFEKRTYVFKAREGQQLDAQLTSDNTGTRFGDNSTQLGYNTIAGENYVMIWNNGRAVSNYKLKVSIH